jgi:hypothetical protein
MTIIMITIISLMILTIKLIIAITVICEITDRSVNRSTY